MKLGLGTAQFGLDYGVSNRGGITPPDEIAGILAMAAANDIEYLDTSPAYGKCELHLGAALPQNHRFRIVTKTPNFAALPALSKDVSAVTRAFERSIMELQQTRVYGLLVHNANDLLGPIGDSIWRVLQKLREQGLIEKIGVSVYTAEQIDVLLPRYNPMLVQVPISIVDQRLIKSGHLADLKSRNIEVHARSIFLQGLLLMTPDEMPHNFQKFRPDLFKYEEFITRHGLSPLEGALSFIKQVESVDVALVGINCQAQLGECLRAFGLPSIAAADFSQSACHNETLLNPALWPAMR